MLSDGYVAAIFGAPGSGKTTLATRMIERDARDGRRVIIHDPTGDIEKGLRGGNAAKLNIRPEHIRTVRRAQDIPAAFNRTLFVREAARIVIVRSTDRNYPPQAVLWAADREWSRGYTIVFDEAEEVWGTTVPRGLHLSVLKRARNTGQRIIATGQRPQYTATMLRSNATHVAVFHADSGAFVNPGCKEFGDPELFESAVTLKRFEYLYRESWRDDARAALPRAHALNSPLLF